MDYFKLTRAFWDYAFENPEKIKPNHCALYLFIVEHCNRLGWKKKFGLPTTMAKDAIGIRSYNTYITTLNELVEFGLIELIEKSTNQYSSNIVAISNFDKALDKSLDKAVIKHNTKQSESTVQSTDSIDKQDTIDNNIIYREFLHLSLSMEDFKKLEADYTKEQIDNILESIENYKKNTSYKSLYLTAKKWLLKEYPKGIVNEQHINKWDLFIEYWNKCFSSRKITDIQLNTKRRYNELIDCGYCQDDIIKAIKNGSRDEALREKIDVNYFSYSANVEKYLKYKPLGL